MRSLSDYTLMVEEAIASRPYASMKPEGLYAPVAYGWQKGGKRIRPVLLLMAAEAFGGRPEDFIKPALGIEMFHNFTLLHDDVMDRSDLRRGRPTVHRKWDENTAILSGDTMLTLATELVADVPDNALRRVLDAFNRMAVEVYEGQRLDMDFESCGEVSVEDYLDMIEKKTSALLGASAKIGAIAAGASEEDCGLIYEYGVKLGLAFQIQDYYLDMFGDPATFGKPIGGDVNNGKKAFMLVSMLERGGSGAEALREAMDIPAGDLRVSAVRGIYERAGMPELCRSAIERYSRESLKALRKSSLPEQAREPLERLVAKLIDRRK